MYTKYVRIQVHQGYVQKERRHGSVAANPLALLSLRFAVLHHSEARAQKLCIALMFTRDVNILAMPSLPSLFFPSSGCFNLRCIVRAFQPYSTAKSCFRITLVQLAACGSCGLQCTSHLRVFADFLGYRSSCPAFVSCHIDGRLSASLLV